MAHARLLPCAAMAMVFALRLALGRGGASPHLFPDEIGYLAGARSFVTEPAFPLGPAPFYYPLYSLLIAPVFAFGLSASSAFTAVMVVNAVLGAMTTGALYVATRRVLGATPGFAFWAALITGIYPGQALFTTSAWAENLLPLLVLLWLLALHWFLERRTPARATAVVVSAVAGYGAHPRGIVLLGLTLVVGVTMLAFGRTLKFGDRGPAIIVIAGAIGGYLVVRPLVDTLLGSLYRSSNVSLQEGGPLASLFDPGLWGDLATRLLGAVWYQLAATAGLAVVGVITLVQWTRVGVQSARRAVRTGRTAPLEALTPVALLALIGTLVLGAAAFLADGVRADNFFGGRYVDAGTPLLLAAGVVGLIGRDARARLRVLGVSAAALVVMTLVFAALTPDLGPPRPFVGDMTLGLAGQVAIVGGPRSVALAGVALGLIGLLAGSCLRRHVVGLAAIVVAFAALALVGRYSGLAKPYSLAASLEDFAIEVAELAHGAPVGVDLTYATAQDVGVLGYQWFRPDLALYDLDATGEPRSAWVVGALRWTAMTDRGAQLVLIDPSRAVGLYVLPGDEQARLRERGGLLPDDFPAVLAGPAARSSVSGPASLSIPTGAARAIDVRVAHRGTGSRWPRFDPDGAGFAQARVRVGARVLREGVNAPTLATYFGDLPVDLLPGDEAVVRLWIDGNPGGSSPLAPGTYRMLVDLYQVDVGWFAERYGQVPLEIAVTVGQSQDESASGRAGVG